jgi:hypothetical protein
MKKNMFKLALSLAVIVAIAFTFSACDLFGEAVDVNFTRDLETSVTVVPGETINVQKTIDLANDPEIAKYKDKIKEVVVESATYHVEEYVGTDDAIVNGEAAFMGTGGNGVAYTMDAVSLKAATSPVSFGFDGIELVNLGSHLKNEKEAVFSVNGTLNHGANFGGCKLVVTLKLKIKAEAL